MGRLLNLFSRPSLTPEEELIQKERCPFCKGKEVLAGPEGGLSINLTCEGCGALFNLHRIPGAPSVEILHGPLTEVSVNG